MFIISSVIIIDIIIIVIIIHTSTYTHTYAYVPEAFGFLARWADNLATGLFSKRCMPVRMNKDR